MDLKNIKNITFGITPVTKVTLGGVNKILWEAPPNSSIFGYKIGAQQVVYTKSSNGGYSNKLHPSGDNYAYINVTVIKYRSNDENQNAIASYVYNEKSITENSSYLITDTNGVKWDTNGYYKTIDTSNDISINIKYKTPEEWGSIESSIDVSIAQNKIESITGSTIGTLSLDGVNLIEIPAKGNTYTINCDASIIKNYTTGGKKVTKTNNIGTDIKIEVLNDYKDICSVINEKQLEIKNNIGDTKRSIKIKAYLTSNNSISKTFDLTQLQIDASYTLSSPIVEYSDGGNYLKPDTSNYATVSLTRIKSRFGETIDTSTVYCTKLELVKVNNETLLELDGSNKVKWNKSDFGTTDTTNKANTYNVYCYYNNEKYDKSVGIVVGKNKKTLNKINISYATINDSSTPLLYSSGYTYDVSVIGRKDYIYTSGETTYDSININECTITSDASWCVVNTNKTITLTNNTTDGQRTCNLTIECSSSNVYTLNIRQEEAPNTYKVYNVTPYYVLNGKTQSSIMPTDSSNSNTFCRIDCSYQRYKFNTKIGNSQAGTCKITEIPNNNNQLLYDNWLDTLDGIQYIYWNTDKAKEETSRGEYYIKNSSIYLYKDDDNAASSIWSPDDGVTIYVSANTKTTEVNKINYVLIGDSSNPSNLYAYEKEYKIECNYEEKTKYTSGYTVSKNVTKTPDKIVITDGSTYCKVIEKGVDKYLKVYENNTNSPRYISIRCSMGDVFKTIDISQGPGMFVANLVSTSKDINYNDTSFEIGITCKKNEKPYKLSPPQPGISSNCSIDYENVDMNVTFIQNDYNSSTGVNKLIFSCNSNERSERTSKITITIYNPINSYEPIKLEFNLTQKKNPDYYVSGKGLSEALIEESLY